ncbi:hypothetical protein D3C79_830910 [compost metagenome]
MTINSVDDRAAAESRYRFSHCICQPWSNKAARKYAYIIVFLTFKCQSDFFPLCCVFENKLLVSIVEHQYLKAYLLLFK